MTESVNELADYLNQPEVSLTVLADGSGVILDIAASQVITLNDTGVFLVEAIKSGAADSRELVERLMDTYEVDETSAQADVSAFAAMLSGHLITSRARQGE